MNLWIDPTKLTLWYWSFPVFIVLPWFAAYLMRRKYRISIDWGQCLFYSLLSVGSLLVTCASLQGAVTDRLILTLIFLIILLFVTQTDMWTGLIPNFCTFGGMFFFLIWNYQIQPDQFLPSIYRFVLVLFFLSLLVGWTGCMGWGDVKLIAMSSLIIEGHLLLLATWIATVSAVITLILGRFQDNDWHWQMKIPFAPHLAMGLFCSYLYGYRWYGSLLTLYT